MSWLSNWWRQRRYGIKESVARVFADDVRQFCRNRGLREEHAAAVSEFVYGRVMKL